MSPLPAILACAVLALAVPAQAAREARLVQTLQGPVRGYKDSTQDFFAFYGIPYATAPTGENRYKPPLPGPAWSTPLEATDDTILCPQAAVPITGVFNFIGKKLIEQCLVLHIFVPNTKETNLPVVVFVHGGAFQICSGIAISPKKMVTTQNIIAVTFNYRLGINGFLCLGTESAPGNAGMKDMLSLLRWVKANIANFGGNPNDVTIDGQSAGGAAVELLMLSKAANGLFTKVIPESNSGLAPYAVQVDPIANAKEFAQRYITDVNNITALDQFYKTASIQTITSDTFFFRKDTTFLFQPCIERDTSIHPFLTDSPYHIIKTGKYKKMPLLYGFDNMEGKVLLPLFLLRKGPMNEKFSDFLPPDLQFKNEKEKEEVAQKVKEFYFGNKKIDFSTILTYVDLYSDFIIYPIMKALKLYVEGGHDQIFLYEYSFYDNNTAPVNFTNARGAGHTAQTVALMDEPDGNLSKEYKKMKNIIRQLWGNFIKNGAPVPTGSSFPAWPPLRKTVSPYMSLNQTIELLKEPILAERMKLWDDLHKKYYRPPSPPITDRYGIPRGRPMSSSGRHWAEMMMMMVTIAATFLNIFYF